MNKRPLAVTIIGIVYILTGAIGLLLPLVRRGTESVPIDMLWVELVRLAAIVSGVFMLRGHNWARWLAVGWIAFHVILSAFHTIGELAIHSVLCAILAYFLFRPEATRYFRFVETSVT